MQGRAEYSRELEKFNLAVVERKLAQSLQVSSRNFKTLNELVTRLSFLS